MATYPILIVEADNGRAVDYAANLAGYTTERATSSREALRLIENGRRYEHICIAGQLFKMFDACKQLSNE